MNFQDTILAQGDLIKINKEEISKLKQRNYNLVVENEFLKDENAKLKDTKYEYIECYKQKLDENKILKQQITQLKHKNKAQAKTIDRLINIITDEHYN